MKVISVPAVLKTISSREASRLARSIKFPDVCFDSQWGLIPKNPLARGSFRAVRIGNANKKVVIDPTVK
jgi:hypothetical protein